MDFGNKFLSQGKILSSVTCATRNRLSVIYKLFGMILMNDSTIFRNELLTSTRWPLSLVPFHSSFISASINRAVGHTQFLNLLQLFLVISKTFSGLYECSNPIRRYKTPYPCFLFWPVSIRNTALSACAQAQIPFPSSTTPFPKETMRGKSPSLLKV